MVSPYLTFVTSGSVASLTSASSPTSLITEGMDGCVYTIS